MQVCSRCGAETAELVSFCPTCGSRLALDREYATVARRLFALLVDTILLPVAWGAVLLAFSVVWGIVVGVLEIPTEDEDSVFDTAIEVAMVTALFVVPYGYYAVLEGSRLQATIGKLMLGIRVERADGGRVGYARALGRALARTVSALPLGAGFLIALFDERKRALHDMLAGTVVTPRPPGRSAPRGGARPD